MVTLNVTLPENLKEWVDTQIERGDYTDVGDYVRDLIRRDQQRDDALFEALEEGLASGTVPYSMDEIWERAKKRAAEDAKARA